MKKLIFVLALIVVSVTSFGQCNDHVFGLGTSFFASNRNEFGLNVDVAVLSPTAKWWPSINADLYNARTPQTDYPTAQVGARLNVPIVRGFYLSAGPKYATQGRQKANGYKQWIFDGAATGVFVIVQNNAGCMWLKTSLQYSSTPQQRVFFLVGLQFALTN